MLIVIGGATATGKSDIAIELAKILDGEIISADSMQIYKEFDIGTAKITKEEMQGIPHYMIDIAKPKDNFSVAQYSAMAKEVLNDITSRGKTPIMVGGTGLYINSVIYNYSMSEQNTELREELTKEYETNGILPLYKDLIALDPQCEGKIHPNNIKRVIRALEVVKTTGKSILDKNDKLFAIPHKLYAVNMDRELLYNRINSRVDKMFERGLPEEVHNLMQDALVTFDNQSMQAIGYKEFKEYFSGEKNLTEIKELIKQHSRNYAKRQFTWFKAIPSCKWLPYGTKEEYIKEIITDLH